MLINKAKLHNALPFIITNNSNNKVQTPKDITIGTSESITSNSYSIIVITLTARIMTLKLKYKQTLHKRPMQVIPTYRTIPEDDQKQ